jgi:hypothetical protein
VVMAGDDARVVLGNISSPERRNCSSYLGW